MIIRFIRSSRQINEMDKPVLIAVLNGGLINSCDYQFFDERLGLLTEEVSQEIAYLEAIKNEFLQLQAEFKQAIAQNYELEIKSGD